MDILKIALGDYYLQEEGYLISDRFRYSNEVYKKLTETEILAREDLILSIKSGKYKFQKLNSICGPTEELVLSHKDRYGIPMRLVLSKKSGLMRIDPYLDERSLSLFYQNEYRALYSSNIGVVQYFKNQVNRGEEIYEYLKSFHPLKENTKVIEVGCGSGGILYYFQQKGCECYGCDYGKEYVEYGKGQGVSNLFEGGLESLTVNGKADVVIMSHVLEHMVDPLSVLAEIKAKLLSEKGVLYIAVPGMLYNHPGYENLLSLFCQAHVHYFTLATLDYVCSKAGYSRITGNEKIQAMYKTDESVIPELDKTLYQTIQNFFYKKEKDWIQRALIHKNEKYTESIIFNKLKKYWKLIRKA